MKNDVRLRIGHNEIFTDKGMINSTDVFNFGSRDKNEKIQGGEYLNVQALKNRENFLKTMNNSESIEDLLKRV